MKIDRLKAAWSTAAVVTLWGFSACGGAAPAAEVPVAAEPVIIEWSIGPKGGLGEGNAFITHASWEPKKLIVPVNHPFIIRFVPRDDSTDTVIFSNGLKEEVGIGLENLVVENGQPSEVRSATHSPPPSSVKPYRVLNRNAESELKDAEPPYRPSSGALGYLDMGYSTSWYSSGLFTFTI